MAFGPSLNRAETRGQRLFRESNFPGLTPAHRVLLEEACRITDRLDRLDEIIDGSKWLSCVVEHAGESVLVEVTIDKVLAEARQQELALKALVTELRQAGAQIAPPTTVKGTGVADLKERITARRAPSSR